MPVAGIVSVSFHFNTHCTWYLCTSLQYGPQAGPFVL